MPPRRPRRTINRYDLTGARDLGMRGRPPKSANVEVDTVAIADPLPDPQGGADQRILASANRRVDILEYEHSHGRISVDAYRAGRIAQRVFERAARVNGGSTWREWTQVDVKVAAEIAFNHRIDDADRINAYFDWMRRTPGLKFRRIFWRLRGRQDWSFQAFVEMTVERTGHVLVPPSKLNKRPADRPPFLLGFFAAVSHRLICDAGDLAGLFCGERFAE
jgi:hypothetical protein